MSGVTINRVEVFSGRMPARVKFSYGKPASFPFQIVRVCAGGLEGWGEAMVSSGDAIPRIAASLLGKDPTRLDALIEPFSDVAMNPREGVSMALYDLVGRTYGLPMHVLLGGVRRERIEMMPCLFPEDPDDGRRKAEHFVRRGFRALKTKIFGEMDLDVQIVRAIREVMPEGFLQADANCGYKGVEAGLAAVRALEEAGLTAAEDPAQATVEEYERITASVKRLRVIIDVASRNRDGIYSVAAHPRSCHAVNLHPNMQGPMSDILGRAATCANAGIPVEIGGTGYTGVGTWAHAHVAAVLGVGLPYGELCGHVDHGMPAMTVTELPPIRDGVLTVPRGPGHGGRVDARVLEEYAGDRAVFE